MAARLRFTQVGNSICLLFAWFVESYHCTLFLSNDVPLLALLILLSSFALVVLYSASGEAGHYVRRQGVFFILAFGVMFFIAQFPIGVATTRCSSGKGPRRKR